MGLGAGLDALFEDNSTVSESTHTLRISEIEPNKNQPRKVFDNQEIQNLAESIREHGLIQPIVVRPSGNGMTYQIVAGERRWRACRMAGIDEIPVVIKELSDIEVSQIAIIENVQRENLNPVEEARAYKDLIDTYGMTQEQLAKVIGKSRPYITNTMRILVLPEEVLDLVSQGTLSLGHAKTLASVENKDDVISAAKDIVDRHLNVRQTEKLVNDLKNNDTLGKTVTREKHVHYNNPFYTETEIAINQKCGRNVTIRGGAGGKGSITFDFYNDDDLRKIADELAAMFEE